MRSKELGWFFTMILGAGSLYAQPSDQFRRHTSWKDGLFIGANYQTGTVAILTTNATATSVFQPGRNDMNVGANGLGFNIGYTGYFRDDQMFGMRYYAFLDWNGYGARYKSSPYGGGAYYGSNNMLAYGAAADFFYNFFQGAFYRDDISLDLGFYVGVAIAGNSWLMGVNGQNAMGLPAGAKPSVSAFQFLFDVGIRALVVGAHGIDLGFKIPTINHTYYSDSHYSITFRRTFAFYIGYSYHF